MNKLIFIVDDEQAISKLLSYWLKDKWGYDIEVFASGEEVLKRLYQKPDLILLDIMLPGMDGMEVLQRIRQVDENLPIIMLSAQGKVEVALESLKFGAYDYFPKPIDLQKLEPAIKNAIKGYDLSKEIENLRENIKKEYSFSNIVSADSRMQDVFKLVTKVLNNDITVLIYGESGTGKELVARAIHYNGNRKDNPFVVVNCASIPRELLESELFGHEKGSFTGAHQRKLGKFEVANGGTIFLDEVGELEMLLQAKLLRVIQEKAFDRVGGTELIKTDVRIISATNRDLKDAVEKKEFREDLFYRLNSFPIFIPPLRHRKGDILVLAQHFLESLSKKLGKEIKGFSKKALKLIYDYPWPGNIREMENTIERCMIIAERDIIDIDDLPTHLKTSDSIIASDFTGNIFNDDTIIPFEKLKEESIRHALKVTKGNIVEAAKKLHLGRATIYRLMERYNIEHKVFA
ncbi:MAG: sigma-54-dependent Fis family transcriptional regulator [Ignavibacteria bacterium RIFOXYB2_FULL_35_12]|nr:MAG: sigma-54-dependent Fis family transcriptional regulator [Ignavibacteria bacterium GWA2_36_19]OGU52549.1 MAG: sigma-54-dependent Fis family transcriptional regulator [Ignavibacteria bacterium GWC2_35_8]OGU58543.1 MAG: sigma-54-dependent Fis family transcriptional regulator [Ignavibacteria bacterium GWF2_35_20]OGU77831.1 MAG: sigma-54-dependent Fis family transcriptional regulator [Ignavibacteria bacterium RBG_16_35_7]OGU78469.1 MAG: sigma-54-dependent Fis family transcriptional regulator